MGISTCVVIIAIALCVVIYRRLFAPTNKDDNDDSDVDENCGASLSSSTTRHGVDSTTSKDSTQKPTASLNLDLKKHGGGAGEESHRLMGNQNMYVRVNPTSPISPVFASPNYMPVGTVAQMGGPMAQMGGPMAQMGGPIGQMTPHHLGQFGQVAFSPGHYTPEGHLAFVPNVGTFGAPPNMVNAPNMVNNGHQQAAMMNYAQSH